METPRIRGRTWVRRSLRRDHSWPGKGTRGPQSTLSALIGGGNFIPWLWSIMSYLTRWDLQWGSDESQTTIWGCVYVFRWHLNNSENDLGTMCNQLDQTGSLTLGHVSAFLTWSPENLIAKRHRVLCLDKTEKKKDWRSFRKWSASTLSRKWSHVTNFTFQPRTAMTTLYN